MRDALMQARVIVQVFVVSDANSKFALLPARVDEREDESENDVPCFGTFASSLFDGFVPLDVNFFEIQAVEKGV